MDGAVGEFGLGERQSFGDGGFDVVPDPLIGVQRSVGDAYDNALMECVIGLYKTECARTTAFHHGPYRTVHDVEYATAGWVDWCNQRRLHSSLGYLTPAEFEQAHYAAFNREPQPV